MLQKLQDALHSGKVRFSFKKVDGSVRQAYGSLHPSLLPARGESSSSRPVNPGVMVYYDLDSGGFRSFKKDSLLHVEDVELIESLKVASEEGDSKKDVKE